MNDIEFINNPNLKEKEKLLKIDYVMGFNDLFEVFCPINNNSNNNQYIIYSNEKYILNILEIKTQKLMKELKGHINHITQIKYFSNKDSIKYSIKDVNINEIIKKNEEEEKTKVEENNEQKKVEQNYEKKEINKNKIKEDSNNKYNYKEYIISSDMSGFVILWNINNSYNLEYIIETKYQNYIYANLILYNINNYNFIITSTLGRFNNKIDFSRLYLLSTGKYFNNIYRTNRNNTTYILPWHNKQNNELYLIEFCRYYISINNIFKEEIYFTFEKKNDYNKYYSGFIYIKNEKDYLISCSYNGSIDIWDLFDKKLLKFLNINRARLYSIIKWNKNYFIAGDFNKGGIYIVDLESFKIVGLIKNKNIKNIISLKKMNHPIYNESILILNDEGIINLWSI